MAKISKTHHVTKQGIVKKNPEMKVSNKNPRLLNAPRYVNEVMVSKEKLELWGMKTHNFVYFGDIKVPIFELQNRRLFMKGRKMFVEYSMDDDEHERLTNLW